MADPKKHKALTTGQIAKLCGVSIATAQKWIDSGEMPFYRLPVTNSERRVTWDNFLAFTRKYDIPTELGESAKPYRVVIAGIEGKAQNLVKKVCAGRERDIDVRVCDEATEFLLLIGELSPTTIIFDYHLEGLDALRMMGFLRQDDQFRNTNLVVVSDLSDEEQERLKELNVGTVLSKNYKAKEFTEALTKVIRGSS